METHNRHHSSGGRQTLRSLVLHHPAWAAFAIFLIAFNLRPAITSVAPFLAEIQQDYDLSGAWISVLTTAPVICLGLFGPLAPPLARRFGNEAVLLASLIGIVVGCVLRSFGVFPLFAGTVVIGASMSVLGILTPVVVKRDFPRHVGRMMGAYTMLISLGAAVSTASAAPFRAALGSWHMTLLVWALPALAAAIIVIPQLFRHRHPHGPAVAHVESIMGDPIAWQVTGYLALVSALAYAVFTWGPSMLQARGLSLAASGVIVSVSYIAQMATGLLVPMIASRQRDQRSMAALMVVLTLAGLLGFIFAPVWSLTLFSIILGLGQGGAFGLALSLIVLRSGTPHVAEQLSSMSQTIGYIVGGGIGPFAVGIIHDATASWRTVAVFYVIIGVATLFLGLGAGRAKTVQTASMKKTGARRAAGAA